MKSFFLNFLIILILVNVSCKKNEELPDAENQHSGKVASQRTSSISLVEIGGSNYPVYDCQPYLDSPTDATWYSDGALDLVIGHYHLDPAKVNLQLQQMYLEGQRKIALVIWFGRFGNNNETFGHLLNVNGGKMRPQHEANYIAVLNKISEIGFNEVMIRFVQNGDSDPGNWSSWNETLFQENWNYIFNAVTVGNNTLNNKTIRRTYDLGGEQGGLQLNQMAPYVKKLWQNYTYVFGNNFTCGFSIAHAPGRLKDLIANLQTTNILPYEYSITIYKDEVTAINTIRSELKQMGQLSKEIIIQEGNYNDDNEMNNILATAYNNIDKVKVRCFMQWPLSRGATQKHFSTNFPLYYKKNVKPFVTGSGSGCSDNLCIWVSGHNFDPEFTSIDLRDPNTWAIVGTYKGTDLTRTFDASGQWVYTLRLKTKVEMDLFATTGLRLFVVNPNYSQWSDGILVKK